MAIRVITVRMTDTQHKALTFAADKANMSVNRLCVTRLFASLLVEPPPTEVSATAVGRVTQASSELSMTVARFHEYTDRGGEFEYGNPHPDDDMSDYEEDGLTDDLLRLSRAYLELHVAAQLNRVDDDGEPITEEWLACGFIPSMSQAGHGVTWHLDEPEFNEWVVTLRGDGKWFVMHRELPLQAWPKTRGELRRLCAAVGYPLNI